MLITFLGPDGSGKTSLALAVSKNIEHVNYVYLGGNNTNRFYPYFNAFIKRNRNGVFFTALKYLAIFCNNLIELRRTKKEHTVSDRSPIDELLFTSGVRQKIQQFFHLFYRKPDLIILLTGNPKVLYERKHEISIKQIERYIYSYKKYTEKNKINHITLDTTALSLEECQLRVINEVKTLLSYAG